jgi:hypothetical protein
VIDDCRVPTAVRPAFADLLTAFDMFDPFKAPGPDPTPATAITTIIER